MALVEALKDLARPQETGKLDDRDYATAKKLTIREFESGPFKGSRRSRSRHRSRSARSGWRSRRGGSGASSVRTTSGPVLGSLDEATRNRLFHLRSSVQVHRSLRIARAEVERHLGSLSWTGSTLRRVLWSLEVASRYITQAARPVGVAAAWATIKDVIAIWDHEAARDAERDLRDYLVWLCLC